MTTIDLKDAAGLFDDQRFRNAAIRGARKAAVRGLQVVLTSIIPSRVPKPIDRGIYRASWKVQNLENGAEIYTDAPHAAHIEYGVRAGNVKPGAMMIAALAEWIKRKRLVPQRTSKRGDPAKLALAMAWRIVKSMQRRGIFTHNGQEGLGINKELAGLHLPAIAKAEIERAIEEEANKGGA